MRPHSLTRAEVSRAMWGDVKATRLALAVSAAALALGWCIA